MTLFKNYLRYEGCSRRAATIQVTTPRCNRTVIKRRRWSGRRRTAVEWGSSVSRTLGEE